MTGASSGIGLEFARQFAENGFDLIVAAEDATSARCPRQAAGRDRPQRGHRRGGAFATDTEFFERADMLDTKVGTGDKDDPADVARDGFEALMNGARSG